MQIKPMLIEELISSYVKPNKISGVIIQEKDLKIVIDLLDASKQEDLEMEAKLKALIQDKYPNYFNVKIIFSSIKNIPSINPKEKLKVPNVEKVVLFASSKGGVGKSTTTVNTALALSHLGFKVGLVDADIYGPSLSTLLGVKEKPEVSDGKIVPILKNNIYSISMGYLIEEGQAAIWRGPMISKALYQLLLSTKWPKLDYLLIDMPPGTGDIYLSMAEKFEVDAAVLITTPQVLSFTVLKKSVSFFKKTDIKILGVIENMSYLTNPLDGTLIPVFGKMIDDIELKKYSLELLARIPLMPEINSLKSEEIYSDNEGEFTIYKEIANIITEKLKKTN